MPRTRWGTSYFVNKRALIAYYRQQGSDRDYAEQMLSEGNVYIGKPPIKAGERLVLADDNWRYMIEEAPRKD